MSRQCSAFDCHLSMSKLKKLQIWRSIKCIICFSFLVTNYTNRIFDHLTKNERNHQSKWGVMKTAAILGVDSERRQHWQSTEKKFLLSEKYSFLCQRRQTSYSIGWRSRLASTAAFFSVDCRLHFSSRPIYIFDSLAINTESFSNFVLSKMTREVKRAILV